jgi:hypothetical protein
MLRDNEEQAVSKGARKAVQKERHTHRDTLRMDGTKVGVLEKADEVGFRGLLQSYDGR